MLRVMLSSTTPYGMRWAQYAPPCAFFTFRLLSENFYSMLRLVAKSLFDHLSLGTSKKFYFCRGFYECSH